MKNMSEKTLYEETLEVLRHYKKRVCDVRWVGSSGEPRRNKKAWMCTWNKFRKLAGKRYGENDKSRVEVCMDLVVVGDDWYLAREYIEYSPFVCWAFYCIPKMTDLGAKKRSPRIFEKIW